MRRTGNWGRDKIEKSIDRCTFFFGLFSYFALKSFLLAMYLAPKLEADSSSITAVVKGNKIAYTLFYI